MRNKIELFIMGFIQIFCIVLNTYLICHNYMEIAIISQFFVTFVWTYNVKKISISSLSDRICHASGATFGSGAMYLISIIFKF
jgi:hypothetical protein